MKFIIPFCNRVNNFSMRIAGVFLTVMILLSCGNIFLRLVWMPIKGTYELMGFLSAVVAGLALGYTQLQQAHTAVDALTMHYSNRMKKVVSVANSCICCIFFAFSGWQVCVWANTLRIAGELTETLRISYYPFTYIVGLGFFFLSLATFAQLLESFAKQEGEK